MAKLPEGKTRLDLVREGLAQDASVKKRGRLVVERPDYLIYALNVRV